MNPNHKYHTPSSQGPYSTSASPHSPSSSLQYIDLNVEGMTCVSCARNIEKAVLNVDGVKSVNANFATGITSVAYWIERTNPHFLINAINKAGYHAHPKSETEPQRLTHIHEWEQQGKLIPFITAALLTFPFLFQMIGHALGLFGDMPLWLQAILSGIVQFWCGWRFYKGAYHAIHSRSPNMDLLIALGTSAAYFFSLFVTLFNLSQYVYFETSAVIITLILMGRWLESRYKAKASAAVEKLLKLQPKSAQVKKNGIFIDLPIDKIQLDDLILIRAGENIPVDGDVIEGDSYVNEAFITGESMPLYKGRGSTVFAGTTNQNGALTIRATKIGSETFFAALVRLMEQMQQSKAPIQRLADTISGYFVPIVLLISLITFIFWLSAGYSTSTALINAIAVLVIACPCALGLATPVVIIVANGLAATEGILFKEAAALEEAEKLNTVIFDKTGTLTTGRPTLKQIIPTTSNMNENEILRIAASLENYSQHPLAWAIVSFARNKRISLEPIENFASIPGKGIKADKRGRTFYAGSVAWAKQMGMAINDQLITPLEKEGHTLLLLWDDHHVLGILALSDTLRIGAKEAIQRLRAMKIHTILLTGDHSQTAAAISSQVQIQEYFAEVLPEQKVKEVALLKNQGNRVGMVGDGINDAPALATANVGFALGASSDIALEAADITLLRDNLLDVPKAIELSKASMKKIRLNLFFAFFYNILAIPLAAMGYLNPMIAAGAMALSSVCVIVNALTLRNKKRNSY